MKPEVIVHNTVSLDGKVAGFEVDMALHYEVAGAFGAEATLIGSGTARAGLEMFGPGAAADQAGTDAPPIDPADPRPVWVLVDSRGLMVDQLHVLWASGYCRGVVVGITESTPPRYVDYLRRRGVEHHVLGKDRVDLRSLLMLLGERYGVRRVLVDSGPTLVGALIGLELVDRVSLIVAAKLLAGSSPSIFSKLEQPCSLELEKSAGLRGASVHLVYRIPGPRPCQT